MNIKQKVDEILAERKKCNIRDLEKLEQLLIETICDCDNFEEITIACNVLCDTHEKLLELKK